MQILMLEFGPLLIGGGGSSNASTEAAVKGEKVGRNDSCSCGSKKKHKVTAVSLSCKHTTHFLQSVFNDQKRVR